MPDLEFALPKPASGSGRYDYLLNGEATGVEESFDVVGDDGGWQLTSVRTAPGGTELRADVSATGDRDATCTLSFRSEEIDRITAEYTLANGALSVAMNEAEPSVVTAEVLGAAVLSPLLRVFQGPTVAATIRVGGRRPVVIPRLDPTDAATLLTPTVDIRTAEPLGVDAVGTGDEEVPWRHCRYVGGNYDDSADFWLDDADRLVRYRFPQSPEQLWEVELTID
ncbi:MAG: hypothetical protein ACR2OH_09355 [Microthrixaceae bacterium]